MNPLSLKDPAGFGNEFLRLTLLQGFQSLTKRDLELLMFVLLERDGGRWIYEIKLLQPGGQRVKLKLDARTAELIQRKDRHPKR